MPFRKKFGKKGKELKVRNGRKKGTELEVRNGGRIFSKCTLEVYG